ncbi:MAG: YafY family protein [Bacteroidia bacterium]
MAYTDNISRLSRLTSILLKLQSQSYVSVNQLAQHFEVSTRTIYRDLLSLEHAGVPIVSIEGKGYTLMDGFSLPPVMFTETEANAIIIAEKMILQTTDVSLIAEFQKATEKIKSVLPHPEREKADILAERIIIGKNWANIRTSDYLTDIQQALTHYHVLKITYRKENAEENSIREVEPFAIYHNQSEQWVLIAWCRLRNEFRNFRVDRIHKLEKLSQKFTPHTITLDEYIEIQRKKHFGEPLT